MKKSQEVGEEERGRRSGRVATCDQWQQIYYTDKVKVGGITALFLIRYSTVLPISSRRSTSSSTIQRSLVSVKLSVVFM